MWQCYRKFDVVFEDKRGELPHLRGLRRRAVPSQGHLAERSGVARETIPKLETGQRRAYSVTVRKLAAGLEVEPRLLLGGAEYSEVGPEENPWEEPEDGKKVGF